MSCSILLRALVCDPQKSSRERLCNFLNRNALLEESTWVTPATDLMEILATQKSNILFIDPFGTDLGATSKLIFQVREKFPQVVICLYVRPGEIRRHAAEYYAGERERFGHYFTLNKELTEGSFEEEAYLMIAHCYEAVRRSNRRAGAIQLTVYPRFKDEEAGAGQNFSADQQRAKETTGPARVTEILPAGRFLSSLPGFKNLTGFFLRP